MLLNTSYNAQDSSQHQDLAGPNVTGDKVEKNMLNYKLLEAWG